MKNPATLAGDIRASLLAQGTPSAEPHRQVAWQHMRGEEGAFHLGAQSPLPSPYPSTCEETSEVFDEMPVFQ